MTEPRRVRSILNSNLERLKKMKKIYIALAIMAAAALTSCRVEEPSFNGAEVGENAVVFGINKVTGTKASDRVVSYATLPGRVSAGKQSFILEETVERLDGTPVASTKGTPAYTENVGSLYGDKLGVYSPTASFGDATYEVISKDDGAGWRYHHNYAASPWPDDDTEVDFYFRMPTDMSGVDGDFAYAKTDGKQTISFSYTTPETASEQQDILFGARSASKADYLASLPSGVPVLLQHALTGVKFRIVNNDDMEKSQAIHTADNTETYIEKVVISGSLVDWGDELIPLFTLAIRVETDTATRIERLRTREREHFGNRIDPGGDMYENHKEFIEWAASYDEGGTEMRSKAKHDEWQKLLSCPVVLVDGSLPVETNLEVINKKGIKGINF